MNRKVVSSLRCDGPEMGASPITHSLTLGNTPGPQLPSCELGVTPLLLPIPALHAGQTHLWLRRRSAHPQHLHHANMSAQPQGPHTTHRVQPRYIACKKEHSGCNPEPSCSKNPPFPRHTTRMGAGKGLGDTEPAQAGGNSTDHPLHLCKVFLTPETCIRAALPQDSPTGLGSAKIHARRATAAQTQRGDAHSAQGCRSAPREHLG